jgi:hypothetical protein
MSVTWTKAASESDRRVAVSGALEIGAVFPPIGASRWRWRFFLGSVAGPEGEARTELAARNALLTVWATWLARAELTGAAE